ncbi:MAG: hypothetical protein KA792_05060 [Bacteroidales bacterium]|nr:hypothetical protein [Bacteroidales bacterium]
MMKLYLLFFFNLLIQIFNPVFSQCDFKVIGHRGSSNDYPENTLIAIEQAFIEGAYACEVDIRLTKDNVCILMHDLLVDRTTNGKGAVSQLNYSYIKTLDAGSWKSERFKGTKVPTLLEAIKLADKYNRKLYLDLKGTEPEIVANILQSSGAPPDILMPNPASFGSISLFHSYLKEAPLVYFGALPDSLNDNSYYEFLRDNNVIALEMAATDFHKADKNWLKAFIEKLHFYNIEYWVYTINDEKLFEKLKAVGVDGLETDRTAAAFDYFCNNNVGGFFPEKKITGQWDFIYADLRATIGSDLNERGDTTVADQRVKFGSTSDFGIPGIDNKEAKVVKIPAYDPYHYLEFYSNIIPEGDTIGTSCDHSYSIILDLLKPVSSADRKISLLQCSHNNNEDADFFIDTDTKGIGVYGKYHGLLEDSTWYRIAIVFDIDKERIDKYINGRFVGSTTLIEDFFNRRFCLNNNWGIQASCFFSDDDNETDILYINSIQLRNYIMTADEIERLASASVDKISGFVLVDSSLCPLIINNPNDTLVCEGGKASFSVVSDKLSNYKWQVNRGDGWTELSGNMYKNGSTASLIIEGIPSFFDGFKYRCIISNNCAVTSSIVTLKVKSAASSYIEPSGIINLCRGKTIILKSKTQEVLSFQWLKNGKIIDNATNSFIEISDYGKYNLLTSDNNGCSPLSDTVLIKLIELPGLFVKTDKPEICSGDSTLLLADIKYNESFESGDINAYNWSVAGNALWTISDAESYKGKYSIRSGIIDNLQNTELSIDFYEPKEDSLSFYIKLSTEINYDYLYLYINNIAVKRWSGIKDWHKESFPVKAGYNRFKWIYVKDKSQSTGSDCVWLDNITLSSAIWDFSYRWKKDNEDIISATNSIYYAKEDGNYSLNIINNENCAKTLDSIIIKIKPLPKINLGNDTSITLYETIELNAGNGHKFYKWSNDEINQSITVEGSKFGIGNFIYSVTVTDENSCTETDEINIKIINGLYKISGQLFYNNVYQTPLNKTLIYLLSSEDKILDSLYTDSTGKYNFLNLKKGKYMLIPVPSQKWDGVNPIDALLVNKYFIKLYDFKDDILKKAADVNDDNKTNPVDALLINRRFIKIINSYSASDWIFDKDTLQIYNSDLLYNIRAVFRGDVNGSFKPEY